MYYKNGVVADLEDMLMDFLVYRKNKQMSQVSIQSDIGKGWPHYKSMQLPDFDLQGKKELLKKESEMDVPIEHKWVDKNNSLFATQNEPEMDIPIEGMLPRPLSEPDDEQEIEFLKLLYSEINKKLEPYVESVLSQNEYTGSPVMDEYIDRETIARIVDQVLELAANDLSEVGDIVNEAPRNIWSRPLLLRAIIEGLVIRSLYWRRRFLYNGHPVKRANSHLYL